MSRVIDDPIGAFGTPILHRRCVTPLGNERFFVLRVPAVLV